MHYIIQTYLIDLLLTFLVADKKITDPAPISQKTEIVNFTDNHPVFTHTSY